MPTTRLAPDHTLYLTKACPECKRVRKTLAELDLEVGFRSIDRDTDARERLQQGTGTTTVPALQVASDFGDNWISGADEIVDYLNRRFGPRSSSA
jgi:glutaredoxin 3